MYITNIYAYINIHKLRKYGKIVTRFLFQHVCVSIFLAGCKSMQFTKSMVKLFSVWCYIPVLNKFQPSFDSNKQDIPL